MFNVPELKTDRVHCYIDAETRTTRIIYQGEIDASVTSQVYGWMMKNSTDEVLKKLRGTIFDFRSVKSFNPGNLSTVQRKSRELNSNINEYQIPVALVVANFYQEQMLRIANQVSPGEDRKRIVKSFDEAFAFLDDYNARHKKQSGGAGA